MVPVKRIKGRYYIGRCRLCGQEMFDDISRRGPGSRIYCSSECQKDARDALRHIRESFGH